jgi:hypothetical protein
MTSGENVCICVCLISLFRTASASIPLLLLLDSVITDCHTGTDTVMRIRVSYPTKCNCKVETFEKFPERNIYSSRPHAAMLLQLIGWRLEIRKRAFETETRSESEVNERETSFLLFLSSFFCCCISACMHDIVYFNLCQESILEPEQVL